MLLHGRNSNHHSGLLSTKQGFSCPKVQVQVESNKLTACTLNRSLTKYPIHLIPGEYVPRMRSPRVPDLKIASYTYSANRNVLKSVYSQIVPRVTRVTLREIETAHLVPQKRRIFDTCPLPLWSEASVLYGEADIGDSWVSKVLPGASTLPGSRSVRLIADLVLRFLTQRHSGHGNASAYTFDIRACQLVRYLWISYLTHTRLTHTGSLR